MRYLSMKALTTVGIAVIASLTTLIAHKYQFNKVTNECIQEVANNLESLTKNLKYSGEDTEELIVYGLVESCIDNRGMK